MNNPMINMLFNAMKAKGITFPQNVNTNDPNVIIQYLMNNGKISQDQYNAAYQKYRQMYPQQDAQNSSQQ